MRQGFAVRTPLVFAAGRPASYRPVGLAALVSYDLEGSSISRVGFVSDLRPLAFRTQQNHFSRRIVSVEDTDLSPWTIAQRHSVPFDEHVGVVVRRMPYGFAVLHIRPAMISHVCYLIEKAIRLRNFLLRDLLMGG